MRLDQKAKLLTARIRFLKEEYDVLEETNQDALDAFKDVVLSDKEIVAKINKKSEQEQANFMGVMGNIFEQIGIQKPNPGRGQSDVEPKGK